MWCLRRGKGPPQFIITKKITITLLVTMYSVVPINVHSYHIGVADIPLSLTSVHSNHTLFAEILTDKKPS